MRRKSACVVAGDRCLNSSTSTCTPSSRCSTARAASTSCSTRRRSSGCRRWPSPSTATCSRRSCSTTPRASAASSRFSGARSTSRPAAASTRAARIGETANHLVLLAENDDGFKNLIKLVSAGYTEGFYYKPRIDKELLAGAQRGPHRPEQLPQRRGGVRDPRRAGEAGDGGRGHAIATSSAPGNFFLEMQFQGIDEQRIVNTGLLPIARDLNLPLVCTNDVHYLRQDDFKPHDILLCIGTGKSVNDEQRLRYHGDQFFLKTAAEMVEIFKDYPDALANTMRDRRAGERRDRRRAEPPAELRGPRRVHARRLLRAHRAPGVCRSACRGCNSSQTRGSSVTRWATTSSGSRTRSR